MKKIKFRAIIVLLSFYFNLYCKSFATSDPNNTSLPDIPLNGLENFEILKQKPEEVKTILINYLNIDEESIVNPFVNSVSKGEFLKWLGSVGGNIINSLPLEAIMWGFGNDKNFKENIRNNDYQIFRKIYSYSLSNGIEEPDKIIIKPFIEYIKDLQSNELVNSKKTASHNLIKTIENIIYKGQIRDEKIFATVAEAFIEIKKKVDSYATQRLGIFLYARDLSPRINSNYTTIFKEQLPTLFQLKGELQFNKKDKGCQPGIIAINSGKKYYIKAHQKYPIKNCIGYEEIFSTVGSSSSNFSSNTNYFNRIEQIDLKELFAYKVMESFNFAPKTKFIINKSLPGGLYIATEGISNFLAIGELTENINNKYQRINNNLEILRSNVSANDFMPRNLGSELLTVDLTAFDILARSMMLSDLNENNLGFITSDDSEIDENFGAIGSLKTFIVDFIVPSENIIIELNKNFVSIQESKNEKHTPLKQAARENKFVYVGLIDSFEKTNTHTKYSKNWAQSILDGFFKFDIDYSEEEKVNHIKLIKKKYGFLAMNRLNNRENNIIKNIEKAFSEIKNLYKDYKPNNEDFTFQVFNIESNIDPLEDLFYYKEATIKHILSLFDFFQTPDSYGLEPEIKIQNKINKIIVTDSLKKEINEQKNMESILPKIDEEEDQ